MRQADWLPKAGKSMMPTRMPASPNPLEQEAWSVWIDGVGGYQLVSSDRCRIGSAHYATTAANCRIFADLPETAGEVVMRDASHWLMPMTDTIVNGHPIQAATLLSDGDEIAMRSVCLAYRRPHVLSGTATLRLISPHRWSSAVDAVVLMSDCCLIGAGRDCHIRHASLDGRWLLTHRDGRWDVCRHVVTTAGSSYRPTGQTLEPGRRLGDDELQITLRRLQPPERSASLVASTHRE